MRRAAILFALLLALLPTPVSACSGYTVKSGDTLTKIARANSTTYLDLAELNNIPAPYRIIIGQCLRLPNQSTQEHVAPAMAAKGIALADWQHKEDLDTLGASWYYGWGEYCPADDARCVNMVRAMQMPKTCYSVLLVGNEPNAIEPYGAPVSPADAAAKVKAVEAECPQSKLVVGNVSADDWSPAGGHGSGLQWLRSFLAAYPSFKGGIGVHCHTRQSADWCVSQLQSLRRAYEGEMWVTEFSVLSGDTVQFKKLLNYIGPNFTRFAVYTSRQPAIAYQQGWAAPGADLIDRDGHMTAIGQAYLEWGVGP